MPTAMATSYAVPSFGTSAGARLRCRGMTARDPVLFMHLSSSVEVADGPRLLSILQHMGRRNYLIEGLSGTGKTSVCDELQRRGHHAIHGDRELAYRGDPETGEPMEGFGHEHHIWDVEKVRSLVADRSHAATFLCGGSRNFSKFIDLFDAVFVLEVDLPTLHRRLDERPDDEWGGGVPTERELIVRWHQTKEDVPENGIVIDATAPIEHVVDEILRRCQTSA